ncbi:hypothetical protein G4Y79_08555 [Phototrophicus methaneseepsis]|uniref:Uncharacterized protein n=1 Tax=Phototrophicus methaneseepsis TaxID=2710758 RepID=A0A7S8ECF7_9CHLR|nr:hypothetical protein [Phototrophicus methaneseepsis]QPC84410.1 hypothetical protein G4Y79_08555 [Phototrophicus methaneseepsis]
MSKQSQRVPRHFGWNLFLSLHVTSYTLLWMVVMAMTSTSYISQSASQAVLMLLLWTPLMFVHIALHYNLTNRSSNTDETRQSYREGYRDAMRDVLDSGRLNGDDYETVKTRLELIEEEDLLTEGVEKPKRDTLPMQD